MKLRWKILIAFVAVLLLYAGFQSYFMIQQTKKAFQTYLAKEDLQKLNEYKRFFENYIEENGMADLEGKSIQLRPGQMRKRMMDNTAPPSFESVHITNQNRVIIASNDEDMIGEKLSDQTAFQRPLFVNGQTYGYIWLETLESGIYSDIQISFLRGIQKASWLSFIIGLFVAVVISLFISHKMTKPLKELTAGVRSFSKDLNQRPKQLKSNDEFDMLSKAFIDLMDRLEQNETIRKQLVADVAHELRTPLTVLMNRLESLQEGIKTADDIEIAKMYDEVYRLSRLVNDLQELSLADAGQLPIHPNIIDLKTLLEEIAEVMTPLAQEKEIFIQQNAENELYNVEVDEDRIRQIIVNLIGNAIRHSPRGKTVSLELVNDSQTVQLLVRDEGEGISQEDLPYIFERFYRKEAARTRETGGAGLGLSIAKGFVEAHGGQLTVASIPGKGSTFVLTLPKNFNATRS